MSQSLIFSEGSSNPIDSIRLVKQELPQCGPRQLTLQFLCVPINPLDILVIQGKYPVKPQSHLPNADGQLSAIPGSDGVARVVSRGSEVDKFAIGDLVIVNRHCLGTWRTHGVFEQEDLIRLPSSIDPMHAAVMRMGMLPAYFLLRDQTNLEPGDWIIQNGATGAVSHFVTQFAMFFGVRVVNIIRERRYPHTLEDAKSRLQSDGASLVLTEKELRETDALDDKRIKMAIDYVSDEQLARSMMIKLMSGGTLVTAGFLGKIRHPEMDLGQLMWQRNITMKAFRMSDCLQKRTDHHKLALFDWFADLLQREIVKGHSCKAVTWYLESPFSEIQLKYAVVQAASGEIGEAKKVFTFV